MDKDLHKELEPGRNKVILRSSLAQLSGAGTAMHSRTGKSTIPHYQVYKEDDAYVVPKQQVEDRKKEMQTYKKAQLLYTLAMVENEEKTGVSGGGKAPNMDKLREFHKKNLAKITNALPADRKVLEAVMEEEGVSVATLALDMNSGGKEQALPAAPEKSKRELEEDKEKLLLAQLNYYQNRIKSEPG